MPAPAVYLDECVDYNLVGALRKQGFLVRAARDESRANIGDEDDSQLAYASSKKWILVTHNEKHFRLMHEDYRRRDQHHSGIVILPERPPLKRLVIRARMMLTWLGLFSEVQPDYCDSKFIKWGQLQVLLEQGYRLPGSTDEELRVALGW